MPRLNAVSTEQRGHPRLRTGEIIKLFLVNGYEGEAVVQRYRGAVVCSGASPEVQLNQAGVNLDTLIWLGKARSDSKKTWRL